MPLKTEWLTYGKDREHTAYAAWTERAASPLPAVLVIQEAWGVDWHIEDITQRFGRAGYFAMAPDIFSDHGKRPAPFERERMEDLKSFVNSSPPTLFSDADAREKAIAERPEPLRSRIKESIELLMEHLAGPKLAESTAKLVTAVEFLRDEHPLTHGRGVASVGFCMGGALSAQLAGRDPQLKGAVIFYGRPPDEALIERIRCPVIGFYGALDRRITDMLPGFREAMKRHGKAFEEHIYDGAAHAFFNDARPAYEVNASRDAWCRTLEFMGRVFA
jgi:carboxymethylenebutenolidase